jgi:hypothetical protein
MRAIVADYYRQMPVFALPVPGGMCSDAGV